MNVIIEVCASVDDKTENNHLKRFKKEKTNNNWLIHCITVDDVTKIGDFKIPDCDNVNFIYFFHDIDFKQKNFIYCFAGSDDIQDITLDISKKGKTKEKQETPDIGEVEDIDEEPKPKKVKTYEEGKKEGKKEGIQEGKKEIAKNMLDSGLSIDHIIQATRLSKDEINNLK